MADQQVAGLLAATALGLQQLAQKAPPKAPGQAPVVTEPLGSLTNVAPVKVSQIEEAAMSRRNRSAADWQKLTKGFVKGRPSSLEEDAA